jgi:hypothetical protein
MIESDAELARRMQEEEEEERKQAIPDDNRGYL